MAATDHDAAIQRSRLRFKRMRDYAEAIVQAVRDPLVVLDPKLRIKSVNQAFCNTFGVPARSATNRLIYALDDDKWRFHRLRPLLTALLAKNSAMTQCEVNSNFSRTDHRTMLLDARKIQGLSASKPLVL